MNFTYLLSRLGLFTFCFFLSGKNGYACDICTAYLSPSTNSNKSNIELLYRYRVMHGSYNAFGSQLLTKHASHGNDPAFWNNAVHESYSTLEIRATKAWNQRFQSTLIFPLLYNSQKINALERYALNGVGDPSIVQQITLFQSKDSNATTFFRSSFNIGIKAPLGKTDMEVRNEIPNLDLQPGSGSWDIFSAILFNYRFQNIGAETIFSVRYNGRNKENYKYGNAINGRFDFSYKITIKNTAILPFIGIYSEIAFYDQSIIQHEDTGGQIHYLNSGLKFFYAEKLMAFGDFQYALKNNLNGHSQLVTPFRMNFGIKYFLGK